MALRKADRARRLANQIVLLDQPPIVKIPPLRAVEYKIKTGPSRFLGLVCGATQRFSDKKSVRVAGLDFSRKAAPKLWREFVSRIAPEPLEPKPQQMFGNLQAISI